MRACLLLVAALAFSSAAAAQTAPVPRTPDGHPDFQGVWSTKWRTPLERPKEADGAAVIPAERAPALVAALDAGIRAMGNLSPDVDFDWGPFLAAAGGGVRTSLIVEPVDGKRPLTEAARDLAKIVKAASDRAEGPEARGPSERCVRGSGATPFTIAPGNQNRRIVQTPASMVIATEDIGDVRIIDINGRSRPDALQTWTGDSIARWDGDDLAIETHLLLREAATPPSAADQAPRTVVERLHFNSPNEIDYSYTVEDTATYTTPMKVNFLMRRTDEPMYEVACHEGNYSLGGILSGARAEEARTARQVAGGNVSLEKQKRRPHKEAGVSSGN